MSLALRNKYAKQYANNYVETSVTEATPYKLVQLLYEGAIKNLSVAKVFVEHKNYEKKAEHINKVISILFALKSGLDMESGGDVAQNLWALYDYMVRKTFEGSAKNNLQMLEEVLELLQNLNDSWAMMPEQYKKLSKSQLSSLKIKGA